MGLFSEPQEKISGGQKNSPQKALFPFLTQVMPTQSHQNPHQDKPYRLKTLVNQLRFGIFWGYIFCDHWKSSHFFLKKGQGQKIVKKHPTLPSSTTPPSSNPISDPIVNSFQPEEKAGGKMSTEKVSKRPAPY